MRRILVAVAGSAAVLSALAFASQGVTSGDTSGPLSVANMSEPVGDTSQFLPCLCPICTQMRDASGGAVVPVHPATVAVV